MPGAFYIIPLSEVPDGDIILYGGKATNLGRLKSKGFPVPDGSVAGFQAAEHVKNYPSSLEAAGMVHERLLDGNWRYRFTGRMFTVRDPFDFAKIRQQPALITGTPNVTFNLSFQPINPTYEYAMNMTPESLELGKKSGDEHGADRPPQR